ncbi:3-isopropylmalate dehydratase [Lentisphaera profundi]|uniref:3-isopropylmalate dehydratase n=1 Tax=Lentisphaera profundi TaxID=1658616 RepID=A0ABY7VZY3_9BACT|nr:3-isopropylmalate dehydratase [Lentisphaera profundi]WDE98849.1 3-isopropylmalate dehydratase [Lentisphaera profundi]
MNTSIKGKAFVLGDNIDTDQIIPAKYLSYDPSNAEEKKYFGKFALFGVPEGESGYPSGDKRFVTEGYASEYKIIIAGENFGCGSSREHAPLALAEAGAEIVVAQSFARIYFRNSVNGGYLVPSETPVKINEEIATGDELEINLENNKLKNLTSGKEYDLNPLGDIKAILEAGDVFKYAKQMGE